MTECWSVQMAVRGRPGWRPCCARTSEQAQPFVPPCAKQPPSNRLTDLITALRDHLLSSAPAAAEHAGTGSSAAAAASKGGKRRRGRNQGSADAQPSEVCHDLGFKL